MLRSTLNVVVPVIFPPGRARLVTRPNWTGSGVCTMTIGIVAVARFAPKDRSRMGCDDYVNPETRQLQCEVIGSFGLPLRVPNLQDDVSAFEVPQIAKGLAQCLGRPGRQNTDPVHPRRLLRLGCERRGQSSKREPAEECATVRHSVM